MALLLLAMPSRAFTAEQPSATRWHELASYSFDDYKAEFGKAYATAEEEAHRRIDIDRWIVGQLCISRHTNHTLHGSAMLGPSRPRHNLPGASSLPEQQQLAIRFRLALKRAQNAIASGART